MKDETTIFSLEKFDSIDSKLGIEALKLEVGTPIIEFLNLNRNFSYEKKEEYVWLSLSDVYFLFSLNEENTGWDKIYRMGRECHNLAEVYLKERKKQFHHLQSVEINLAFNSFVLTKRVQNSKNGLLESENNSDWLEIKVAHNIDFYKLGLSYTDLRQRYDSTDLTLKLSEQEYNQIESVDVTKSFNLSEHAGIGVLRKSLSVKNRDLRIALFGEKIADSNEDLRPGHLGHLTAALNMDLPTHKFDARYIELRTEPTADFYANKFSINSSAINNELVVFPVMNKERYTNIFLMK